MRHRFAEQNFGLADQLRFHVGEDAVEIECDTKGQLLADVGRQPKLKLDH